MSISLLLKCNARASLASIWRSIRGAQLRPRPGVPVPTGAAAAVLCRALQCNAAVNAHHCTQTAVVDCLQRVLGPSTPSRSEFAVVFYEGHDGALVQKALDSFAARHPEAPPVFGCSLGESGQHHHVDQFPGPKKLEPPVLYDHDKPADSEGANLSSASLLIGQQSDSDSDNESDLTDTDPDVETESVVFAVQDDGEGGEDAFTGDALLELLGNVDDIVDALGEPRGARKRGRNGRRARRVAKKKQLEQQLHPGKRMSMRLVTVLGLGFEGRAEAIPVAMANGAFPDLGDAETVRRIFGLPKEKPPHFLLLCRRSASPGLERSIDRLGNLLPGGSRLAAVSAGERPSVVSSFPAHGKAGVGVCLVGDVSLREQAELASKTLGAFGVGDVRVLGGACDELFVPRYSSLPLPLSPPAPCAESAFELSPVHARVLEKNASESGPGSESASVAGPGPSSASTTSARKAAKAGRRGRKAGPSQLGVFKVDDFVYPGMRRRYHIFEPRYRALVKRCLRDGQALLLLPLSGDGNVVGTAAYVSGLHNVHENGRCDIEITGLARCQVKTMWMRGESFGLHEAVVEYFEDDDVVDAAVGATDLESPPPSLATEATGEGVGSGMEHKEEEAGGSTDDVDRESSQPQPQPYSELQQLRVLVSAVLHRELFRTRRTGFSPIWPTWQGAPPDIAADLLMRGGDGDSNGESFNSGLADLDAESLSFWAAQHVAADAETKLRWLTYTSTEARLRDITARLMDRAAMVARRSSAGGGGKAGSDNLYKLLRDIYVEKGGGGGRHGDGDA